MLKIIGIFLGVGILWGAFSSITGIGQDEAPASGTTITRDSRGDEADERFEDHEATPSDAAPHDMRPDRSPSARARCNPQCRHHPGHPPMTSRPMTYGATTTEHVTVTSPHSATHA